MTQTAAGEFPSAPRTLPELGTEVDWPDLTSAATVQDLLAARPELGQFAEFARFFAAVQQTTSPAPPRRTRAILVNAQPSGSFAELADGLDVAVRYEHISGDPSAAIEIGAALADAEADAGTDLVVLAVPGGDLQTAAALVSAICGVEPVKAVARGGAAASDPERWMAHVQAVRDHRRVAMAHRYDAQGLALALGEPALALAAGFLLRAAARRTAVVLDGLAALAAGVLAADVTAPAGFWWLAADSPNEPAAQLACDRLDLAPVLRLGTALADGTAGVLCVPILRTAVGQTGSSPVERQ